jgi:hypothetical protein
MLRKRRIDGASGNGSLRIVRRPRAVGERAIEEHDEVSRVAHSTAGLAAIQHQLNVGMQRSVFLGAITRDAAESLNDRSLDGALPSRRRREWRRAVRFISDQTPVRWVDQVGYQQNCRRRVPNRTLAREICLLHECVRHFQHTETFFAPAPLHQEIHVDMRSMKPHCQIGSLAIPVRRLMNTHRACASASASPASSSLQLRIGIARSSAGSARMPSGSTNRYAEKSDGSHRRQQRNDCARAVHEHERAASYARARIDEAERAPTARRCTAARVHAS